MTVHPTRLDVRWEVWPLGNVYGRTFARARISALQSEVIRFGNGTGNIRYVTFAYDDRRVRIAGEIGEADAARLLSWLTSVNHT